MTLPHHDRLSFYKYYPADSAKLTLSWATRKWSTAPLFNDPFDNQFDLRFEEPTEERSKAHVARFHEIVRSPVPIADGQFGPETSKVQLIQRALWANPDFEFTDENLAYLREGEMEGMQKVVAQTARMNEELRRLFSDVSIFCLSETHDNLLMWSHYAQNHTGAVIEFLSLGDVDSPLLVAQPVRYTRKLPRLTFESFFDFEAAKAELLNTITLTKSEVWSYEREWRIVAGLRNNKQNFEIISFAREEVGSVYLGCRMTSEDKAEIIGITRLGYPKARILQAAKHDHEFALTFHDIV
jgi:hypothetical protein